MNKDYKTFEELKEELGDKFEEFMYKANIELLDKVNQLESTLNEVRKECETNIRIFDSGKSYSIAIKDVSKDILKILGKRGKSNE